MTAVLPIRCVFSVDAGAFLFYVEGEVKPIACATTMDVSELGLRTLLTIPEQPSADLGFFPTAEEARAVVALEYALSRN